MEGGDAEVSSTNAEFEYIRPWVKPMALNTSRRDVGHGSWADCIWILNTIWSFIVIHLIALKFTLIELCTKHRSFEITDDVVKANKGKWAIVTGGTRGIGREVVRKLYASKMNVLIGCRDVMQGYKLGCELRQEFNFGKDGPGLCVFYVDLNSFFSTKLFAYRVLHTTNGVIHLLVNNAGVMFPPYLQSENGLGRQMQSNHLSHFCLTYQLMPALLRGGMDTRGTSARVINVSSVAHYGATATAQTTTASILSRSNDYQIYMDSKFCQIVTSLTWNKMLEAQDSCVRVLNVHPGIVNTKLYKNVFYYPYIAPFLPYFYKTPRQGADCVAFAALSPTLNDKTPIFLTNSEEREPLRRVTDPVIQERIWLQSCLCTGTPASPFRMYDFEY